MSSKCRFPSCEWSGEADKVQDHCEEYHSQYIREVEDDKKFTFTFDDIGTEAFLLVDSEGLYWYLLDPFEDEQFLRRGIFEIGQSEIFEYTFKIGSINTDMRYDIVKKYVQPESSNKFELVWPLEFLESMDEIFKSKKMEIYFRGYTEEEYTGTYEDVQWSDPEEEKYNNLCLEKFTCPVCFKYIRSNAKFCENFHFLCSNCLEKLTELKKTKCPLCRGDYRYDCVDQEIEELLKCVRFPEEN